MKRQLLCAALLAIAACNDRYGIRFSDTSVPPLQVTLTPQQTTLFEGAVVRTTMSLTVNGSASDNVQEADLELRSDNPQIVEVYRGVDNLTFVLVGATAGQTQLGAFYQDKRIATLTASVASQPTP